MDLIQLSAALKALGDPTRLKIIALLNQRDCCVCELVPIFGISQPSISRHMSRLKTENLVKETRKGQWVFYSLNRTTIEKIGISLSQLPDCKQDFEMLKEANLSITCE
ncbi:winged helix-turn-helix transcriptional regulator [Brevibacillus sp. 7WMA2]|uniref:ArsR/SmtB family transcription factor n=1 Tax=Brevibacillus TaxID=55080 RepID=UPI000B9B1373|nr:MULTISPECIES: metalloregulator ArsR/SmtB family transcription factor [Brevibacillus]AYB41506.1 ArsR family transcriptional regulator [Brevibacillus laterosporus]MBG9774978.1 transcriptional regulator [Brevibacillus laterosporus]MBG9787451.1 transcriptional regulator [Brevibacillus laterosporus]MBG9799213.1 transcriptional regulator [Brevibacillus laterosporus]MCG7317711.1 metalloregulator ArsR/SmtB family transcription factor [Brevibacillus laterosporus]